MKRLISAAAMVALLATTAACGSTVQTGEQQAGQVGANGQVLPGDSLNGVAPQGTVPDGSALPGNGNDGTSVDPGTAPGGAGAGAGGGTGSPSDPGTVPGDGTTPPGQDGTQPPTEGTGSSAPIEIGFITTAASNAESLGLSSGSSYPEIETVKALVAEYNNEGGLAGRKIKPVYAATDTASGNWSNEFQSVCSTLTEDNDVKAVVGYQFIFYDSLETCLAKVGAVHFYGGYQPGDAVAQQQFPSLIATGHPTVDGANLTVLTGAKRSGLIGGSQKLGLLLDSCAHGDRALERSTEPWLKANKIDYEKFVLECPGGAGDAGTAAAGVSSAELRFATAGVDTVFAVGIGLIVFMNQAESQGYRPNYITSATGNGVATMAPRNQAAKLHGYGWMPSTDVSTTRQPYGTTAPQKACLAKLAKHNLQPRQLNDFMTAYQTCDGLDLYAKALAAAKTTDAGPIVSAATSLISKFKGSGTYGGTLQAVSGQRGGPSTYRETAYDTSCSCMVYRGPTYSVPLP